jgi:hypothetical protein
MDKQVGRRARQRFVIKASMNINDVSARGQHVVALGPCGYSGQTKTPDGKKLLKTDASYFKFRIEDKRWVKEHNIPENGVFTCHKDRVNWLLEPAT